MSFGSSTKSRFQVEETTKGGQGIFFLPKENKQKAPKKFNYKEKNVKHPLRSTGKSQGLPPTEEIPKKPVNPNKDFIKKNRDKLARKPTGPNKDKKLNGGTVTLTQEQLNAILESVGNLKDGKENALQISIDPKSNAVKITSPRPDDVDKVKSSRSDKVKSSRSDKVGQGDEKSKRVEDNIPRLELTTEQNSDNEYKIKIDQTEKPKVESVEVVKESPVTLPPVPVAHLTVAEKKRLQWAQEKEELQSETYNPWGRPGAGAPVRNTAGDVLADFNNRQEQIDRSPPNKGQTVTSIVSSRSNKLQHLDEPVMGTLNIGQLTDEEKLLSKKEERQRKLREDLEKQLDEKRGRERKEKAKYSLDDSFADKFSNSYKPVPLPQQVTSPQKSPRRELEPEKPDTSLSPRWLTEQKVPPAAMRSSFAFGGYGLEDNKYKETKAEERRQWIAELEKQKEEKRLLTVLEKEKQKALDAKDAELWAERISPRFENSSHNAKTSPQPESYKQSAIVPDSARTNSAPDVLENSTLIRGQNVAIDPVTLKDLEFKRKRHLEHQAAIKYQIDEKQNNIRKEREKKWAEEQETEERLKREREGIQKQFEMEQQKIREKEQARENQLQQLKAAMDEAQDRALHEKHLKRMHHLQQGGHDITNLKANYDVFSPSPIPLGRSTATSVARQQTDGHYAMTPRGHNSTQQQPNILSLSGVREVDTSFQSSHSHPVQQEHGQLVHHDEYTQNRVMTPYRNLSDPYTDPYSKNRHFGTQTFSGLPGENPVTRQMSEVQIEYETPKEETRPKQEISETKTKKVRLKSAAQVRKFKPEKTRPKEKKGWNHPNQNNKKNIKNSEKDPFYGRKKHESRERHAKRAAQLFKMIEANKPVIPTEGPPGSRDTSPRRNKSMSPHRGLQYSSPRADRSLSPNFRSETRTLNPKGTSPHRGRSVSPLPNLTQSEHHRSHQTNYEDRPSRSEHHKQERSPPVPAVKHRRQHNAYLDNEDDSYYRSHYIDREPVRPPLHDNDFIPFTRTAEFLDPSYADEPIREVTRMAKGWKVYRENQQPVPIGNKHHEDKYAENNNKDPIYNPSLVTDHPTSRQDQILLQLSNLKQNLIQRQRELETCMSPSALEYSMSKNSLQ